MRLEKSRETLQSAALGRVRMFLKADLGWLRGFPLGARGRGVAWVVVPREDGRAPERMMLGREHLQKAVYTYNRLVYRFPHALPRAVEDIGAWKPGVLFLVDLLKPGIQAREPLPPSVFVLPGAFPARAARAALGTLDRYPHLARFVNALGTILLLTPDELPPALQWVDRHASELQNFLAAYAGDDGLTALVGWWELCRRARYREAEFLLPILGDPRAPVIPTHGWAQHVNGLHKAIIGSASKASRDKLPGRPRPVLLDALNGFAVEGLRQSDDVRRRALKLLSLVLDADLLGLWQSAWRRLDETPCAKHHILRGQRPAAMKAEVQRVGACLQGLLAEHPPEIHIETVLEDVRWLSVTGQAPVLRAVCRGLESLPRVHEGTLLRGAFLHDWADPDKTSHPLFAMTVRRFAAYLAAGGRTTARLRPWASVIKDWNDGPRAIDHGTRPPAHRIVLLFQWSFLDQILEGDPDASMIELIFQALEKSLAARSPGLEYEQASALIHLVKQLKDPDLALIYADRLAAAGVDGPYLHAAIIRVAHTLAAGGDDFGRLYLNLKELEVSRAGFESVLALDRDLRAHGWGGIVARAVVSGDSASVLALAAKRKALLSLGGQGEPPARLRGEQAPEWIRQYPPEFAASLTDLAVLGAKAERTARRLMGEDFIPREALRAEIEALESRVRGVRKSTPLTRRLAGLRARLAASEDLPAAKSGRLALRLDRAVPKAVFKVWNARLDDELNAKLVETLGAASIPDEFSGQPFWQVLTSILGLPKEFRELGLELLRRRCGPAPWNFRDHPANRAFLERISRRGLDVAPWIEPSVPRRFPAQNGRPLDLSFADDPLDIFRMGAHFQTCLSPGGFNFYSTVSNAVDINKRVLYVRDEAGRVAGRSLFALSDRGGILTFYPYHHDGALGVPEVVARFAAELAARMRTAVVTEGRVEPLVASRWYDDGPFDTGFRFPCLREGSAFRSQIKRLSPADLTEAVRQALAPLVPSALTVPPIVMLPEIEDRPELVVPLLGILEGWEDVPIEVWTRAAGLALRAGRADQAQRVFNKRIVPRLSKKLRDGVLDKEAIELGLELDPSALLRVFRQTRPKSVKGDEAEPQDRREFIAMAHERLGRKALAGRLRVPGRA